MVLTKIQTRKGVTRAERQFIFVTIITMLGAVFFTSWTPYFAGVLMGLGVGWLLRGRQ